MKRSARTAAPFLLLLCAGSTVAQAQTRKAPIAKPTNKPAVVRANGTGLTLYNQNFAVVRQSLALRLKKGANRVAFENVTARLEPDSVVLRDPAGKWKFRVLEQSYRNDTASTDLLLPLFQGKTLQFLVRPSYYDPVGATPKVITGKLIRAGRNGGDYGSYPGVSPIVEVDGKLRFNLPGEVIFPPSSVTGVLLRPTLQWTLTSETAGLLNAEAAYISSGFTWQASYNLISPEVGDTMDLVGWVTMTNQSGRTFENARIQLVAGDVQKIQPQRSYGGGGGFGAGGGGGMGISAPPSVTEKGFDEYHLYTLRTPTTLRDREQKQVEFARGAGIASKRLYVYDGEQTDPSRYDWLSYSQQPDYDAQQNTKVWVMRELANTKTNGLGIPLPRGRMRVYRRESGTNALQFVGEAAIGHTPKDETVRLYTGDAFDIVGERRHAAVTGTQGREQGRVQYNWEIKLRNHKKELVEVRVVEHIHPRPEPYAFWEITKNSDPFVKVNAFTVEFRVTVKPDEEKVVTYSVVY